MKTIADFKRAVTVGSKWHTTHNFVTNGINEPIKDMGVREVGKVQSNCFAFRTLSGELSYCDWPTKKEFSVENDGKTAVLNSGFAILNYTEVEKRS